VPVHSPFVQCRVIISGLHHVTAFARSPRVCIDFYTRVLGLRTVKITVNYDDPGTYHLYFADRIGSPGTVLTFFPRPDARPGRVGSGQATLIAFAVPRDSIDFWSTRMASASVDARRHEQVGARGVRFEDPDGLPLALVATDDLEDQCEPWATDEVPLECAIRGLQGVTMTVLDAQPSINFVHRQFGFRSVESEGTITRLEAEARTLGSIVNIRASAEAPRGRFGPGTVHHVAWRVADDAALNRIRSILVEFGVNVTDVKDRNYFRSIYFREPGGVIFELATDGPGFAVDESADDLGSELRLPPWLEQDRERIEAALPAIDL